MIGAQIVVMSNEDGSDSYHIEYNVTGANLGQLSLLLAALHMVEKRVIEDIESIEPDFEVTN